jgi:hypothetical protein
MTFATFLPSRTLAGHSGERWPVGRRWIKLTERVVSVAQSDGPVLPTFRNAAFRVIGRATLQRSFLERGAGLKE